MVREQGNGGLTNTHEEDCSRAGHWNTSKIMLTIWQQTETRGQTNTDTGEGDQ